MKTPAKSNKKASLIEVGPRLAFSTAFSSNSLSMLKACGIANVIRVERSRRYLFTSSKALTNDLINSISSELYDRMTETIYDKPLTSFDNHIIPQPIKIIPLLTEGKQALQTINNELGLGFDDWDLDFYYKMFTSTLQRDPTEVECFDLGQSMHNNMYMYKQGHNT